MEVQTTRDHAEDKFKSVIKDLAKNEDQSVQLVKWCEDVVNEDFSASIMIQQA
jgi:hypothetical protein